MQLRRAAGVGCVGGRLALGEDTGCGEPLRRGMWGSKGCCAENGSRPLPLGVPESLPLEMAKVGVPQKTQPSP